MKKQANFNKLYHFFESVYINGEVCPIEVENFLQEYLKYIFDLNSLPLENYDISIIKVCLTETHPKRAREFKCECNKEYRKNKRDKILTKRGYHAYCENDYYEAIMRPSLTIKNKYDILINQNICKMKNADEFGYIVYFLQIFGHEVHHIIQDIKHVKETERYDYLLSLNYVNIKNASLYYDARDARKIKRLIHQHVSSIYSNCKSELYADKKGYDYLDILFNQITLYAQDNNSYTDEQLKNFLKFLREYQEINEDFYTSRLPYNKMYEKINKNVCKRLEEYGYYGDDLAID